MIITELFDAAKPGYQSNTADHSVYKLSDLRKSRLTLGDLNRLRIAHDVRKIEHEDKLKKVSKQYKPPAAMPGPV